MSQHEPACPSFKTFRHLALPADYVEEHRYESARTSRDICSAENTAMKHPGRAVCRPQIETVFMGLNDIITNLNKISHTDHTENEIVSSGHSSHQDEYLDFERVALTDALAIAQEFPAYEFRIWRGLAEMMEGMNAKLRSADAPELKIVSFPAFLGMTKTNPGTAL